MAFTRRLKNVSISAELMLKLLNGNLYTGVGINDDITDKVIPEGAQIVDVNFDSQQGKVIFSITAPDIMELVETGSPVETIISPCDIEELLRGMNQ